jgi:hypothetical protein
MHQNLLMVVFIAIHMADVNCHFDCMESLIELGANDSAGALPYGATSNLVGK